jgi:histidinol phosphatase-like PHP family hydrolase
MIDLHTHSLLSDGELLPAELVRRAEFAGYRILAITDHADASNLDFVVPRIASVARELNAHQSVYVIPGVEFTHCPPDTLKSLSAQARELGAKWVVVHGETLVEPVPPNTNRAAIDAGVNLLAHPGLITDDEVKKAKGKGVLLEVSTRRGHSLTNGHVVNMARKWGASLALNTDAHSPGDLVSLSFARQIAQGAGISPEEFDRLRESLEAALKEHIL